MCSFMPDLNYHKAHKINPCCSNWQTVLFPKWLIFSYIQIHICTRINPQFFSRYLWLGIWASPSLGCHEWCYCEHRCTFSSQTLSLQFSGCLLNNRIAVGSQRSSTSDIFRTTPLCGLQRLNLSQSLKQHTRTPGFPCSYRLLLLWLFRRWAS